MWHPCYNIDHCHTTKAYVYMQPDKDAFEQQTPHKVKQPEKYPIERLSMKVWPQHPVRFREPELVPRMCALKSPKLNLCFRHFMKKQNVKRCHNHFATKAVLGKWNTLWSVVNLTKINALQNIKKLSMFFTADKSGTHKQPLKMKRFIPPLRGRFKNTITKKKKQLLKSITIVENIAVTLLST